MARSIAAASRAWRSIARRSMRSAAGPGPIPRACSPTGTRPRAIPSTGSATRWWISVPHQLHAEGYNRPVRGHDRLELVRPQRQLSAFAPRIRRHRAARRRAHRLPLGADADADHSGSTQERRLRHQAHGGRCRGVHTVLRPSRRRTQGGDLSADPDSELSCLRQYRHRIRRRLAASDHGRDADLPGDRYRGLQERRRVRSLHLRPAQRRRRRLLLLLPPSDHQLQAEISRAGARRDVAVSGRPVDRRLAGGNEIRLRRPDRRRSAPRRRGRAETVPDCPELHAQRVLLGADDGRDRGLSRERWPLASISEPTATTGASAFATRNHG